MASYWRCYYHIVWATYRRIPILEAALEEQVYQLIRHKSATLETEIIALNGMPDHVHVVVSIPPKMPVAQWVKHVKGASTHHTNTTAAPLADGFGWQSGYGVVTVGPRGLNAAISYVQNQKEHHRDNTIRKGLEMTASEGED